MAQSISPWRKWCIAALFALVCFGIGYLIGIMLR